MEMFDFSDFNQMIDLGRFAELEQKYGLVQSLYKVLVLRPRREGGG